MGVSIRIRNRTSADMSVALHPSLSFVQSQTKQFGAYAKSSISSGGSLYAVLADKFLIAGVYKNVDGSVSVTTREAYNENTTYVLETGNKLSTESNSNGIIVRNDCEEREQYLISNGTAGIWLDTLIPQGSKSLPKVQELFSNLSISSWSGTEWPDFFDTSGCQLQELNTSPQSVWQYTYVTWEIQENVGTGKITLSSPDYMPFSPLEKN